MKPDDLTHKPAANLMQRPGSLRDFWARLPQEELTPEIEQEIVGEVKACRAERRKSRHSREVPACAHCCPE